ncbi:MAG: tol-pal system-associated acyl-CoA thioesterase [Gammaproteobacteria bacterium]|nr:tol-pal system-associated acyl-CoA thioesterase [Gammaproteobacteria bacterium]
MALFSWPIRIYYEDTDVGGVVYYANYLKFMERCRSEWLRQLGFEQDELLQQQKLIFAVHEIALKYRQPARFNDLLTVTTEVSAWRRVNIDLYQTVSRDDTLLCDGTIRLAALDAETLRPKAMDPQIIAALKREKS